jgi:acyl-CoA thioester hydrolase
MTAMAEFAVEISIPVRFRDIDGMGHVNNAVFSTYLELAREAYWRRLLGLGPDDAFALSDYMDGTGFILARMEIDFRAQIPHGGAVRVGVRCSRLGAKSWDFEYRIEAAGGDPVYAQARSVQVAYDYRAQTSVALPADLRARFAEIEGRSFDGAAQPAKTAGTSPAAASGKGTA